MSELQWVKYKLSLGVKTDSSDLQISGNYKCSCVVICENTCTVSPLRVLSTYVVYYVVDISVMPVDGGQLPTDKIPLGIRVPWNVHFVMMKECDHDWNKNVQCYFMKWIMWPWWNKTTYVRDESAYILTESVHELDESAHAPNESADAKKCMQI